MPLALAVIYVQMFKIMNDALKYFVAIFELANLTLLILNCNVLV